MGFPNCSINAYDSEAFQLIGGMYKIEDHAMKKIKRLTYRRIARGNLRIGEKEEREKAIKSILLIKK